MSSSRPAGRRRASSLALAVNHVLHPPADHHLGTDDFKTGDRPASPIDTKSSPAQVLPTSSKASLLSDLSTGQWLRNPASSAKMIGAIVAAWVAWQQLFPKSHNYLTPFLFISYPLPRTLTESSTPYGKGPLDICFLAFYVIVFSFIRQSFTEHIATPLAHYAEIKTQSKRLRFVEQAYAIAYWGSFSVLGLYVMKDQPTWWYQTDQYWIDYPHWRMSAEIKTYYLLQFAYWLQQMLVMVMRLEKPRSDYVELIIHHIVTLWLIGWSYSISLTRIGVSIFVSMDVPDTFLATAKLINYTKWQRSSEVAFAAFLGIWFYFRHWLNLKILYSILTEWDHLIPPHARYFRPQEGIWMAGWMKWQIFIPIFLLQLVNIFWYYLMLRIAVRILLGNPAKDSREEGEDSDDEGKDEKKKQ